MTEEREPSPEELAAMRCEGDFDAPPTQRRDVRANPEVAKKLAYLPDVHRLLPQSSDAERGTLSSFLLSPRDVGGMCAEKRITPDHFFTPAHEEIYRTLTDLWERSQPIDFITLTNILRDRSSLDRCGGAAFVTELFTFLPTAANAAYYIEILLEKWTLRAIIKAGTEFAARGYDEQDNVPDLLNHFEQAVFSIANQIAAQTVIIPPKQAVVEVIGEIERLYERRGAVTGITTGFADLDKMLDGLCPEDMVVIAALSSGGKTALALNIAENIVLAEQKSVGFFSLEMSYRQLWMRLLTSRARVNMARLRDGYLSERDFPALQTAASKLSEAKLWIDDTGELSISEIRARARRMKQTYKIEAVVVDYLQLVTSTKKKRELNREQEVAEISGGLKAMAKELGIPVVVLAQVNAEGAVLRPKLKALRESQRIGQDADKVIFVVRPEMLETEDEEIEKLKGVADLVIAKNRNGPIGFVPLTFLAEFARFETRARERNDEPAGPEQTTFV